MKSPFRDPLLRHQSAPRLETERLVLRHVQAGDIDYFASAHADEEVSRHVGGPIGREDAWRRAMTGAGFWAVLGIGVWAIERQSDGRTIGHIGFFDFQRDIEPSIAGEPEMGWIFAREAQGQGYAREAGEAALAWFDAHFAGTSIPAIIDADNLASIKLAERLGFERQPDGLYRGKPIGIFRRDTRGSAPTSRKSY